MPSKKASKEGAKLGPQYKMLVDVLTGLLWSTGLAWLAVREWLQRQTEFSISPHPMQKVLLQSHAALAFLWLILLGSLVPLHLVPAWELNKSRRSGLLLMVMIVILLVTAYLLYYTGNEEWRAVTSQVHIWIGAFFFPALLVHVWLSRI